MKFDPRSWIRNLISPKPLVQAEGEIPCLLNGPLAGGVGGDSAEVHPACAVLDENQHVQALAQHGVHMQEIDREDPGGLGVQELPPGDARAAWRRIDAGGAQDLPDCGRRHGDAEFQQFALDPAMAPPRILSCQAQHQPLDTRCGRRTARPAPSARVVLLRCQLAVPGHERRGRDGKHLGPAPT